LLSLVGTLAAPLALLNRVVQARYSLDSCEKKSKISKLKGEEKYAVYSRQVKDSLTRTVKLSAVKKFRTALTCKKENLK
jgi:hypothetical protein